MTLDPAIIEAAARAMCTREFPGKWDIISGPNQEWYRKLAVAAVVSVTPLIRAQVLEETTKAMNRDDWSTWEEVVAAVTRALKEQP